MNSLDLRFDTLSSDGTLQACTTHSGVLTLHLDKAYHARLSFVQVFAHTTGEESSQEILFLTHKLPAQDLKAGALELPFEFEMSHKVTPSYRGEMVSITWSAKAYVLLVDLETDEIQELRHGFPIEPSRPFESPAVKDLSSEWGQKFESFEPMMSSPTYYVEIGIAGLVFALAIISYGWWESDDNLGFLLVSSIAILPLFVSLYLFYKAFVQKVTDDMLSNFNMGLMRSPAFIGDSFQVVVGFQCGMDLEINGIELQLVAQERSMHTVVTHESGGNKELRHKTIPWRTISVPVTLDKKSYKKGEVVTFHAEVTLPKDAPSSFEAEWNAVEWELQAKLDIPRWPDYAATQKVMIY